MWFTKTKQKRSRVILWLCFFISFYCNAQITFSTRSYGVINTVYNSVQVLEDGYLTCGWTYDTVPNINRDILLTKFNLAGANIEEFHYGDSSFQSFTQENSYSALENLYIQQASAFDGQPIDFTRLIWYNNMGDTLKTRDYFSPYYLEQNGMDYIRPLYSMLMPDSTIYFTAGIAAPVTFNDVCIWHLDKYGNELWHYIYATEADPETCFAMIPWQGGVMAAIYLGLDGTEYGGGGVLQIIDANGNDGGTIDESVWDNGSSGILAMLLENDYIICAGGIADSPDYNSKLGIWKLDSDGQLIWNSPIGDYPTAITNSYYLRNLVKTIDGNYVVTCDFYYYSNDSHMDIKLIKADSSDGSMMWERYYHFVESQSDMHHAIDLKATPDGGVVFCGDASDTWSQNPNLELPAQQGWIVKLDACGCLVPGCDENCVVGQQEFHLGSAETKFKIGPNPARDYINIYLNKISNVQHSSLNIQVHDLAGNIVKSFAPHRGDTTYIVDTTGLAAGQYVVSLVREGVMVQSEKIVVAR